MIWKLDIITLYETKLNGEGIKIESTAAISQKYHDRIDDNQKAQIGVVIMMV